MGKEIVCGAIPTILVFLWFLGINVTPLLVFGVVLLALYFLVVRQSQGNVSFGGKGKQTKNVVPKSNVQFAEIGGQERAKNELKEALDF